MKLLLTAFSPFGGECVNPSQQALALLPDVLCGASVVKLLLPVSFSAAPKLLRQTIRREKPALIISLGQAGGRAGITAERIAVNLQEAEIPDNDGAQPRGKPVEKGAPDGIFSTLPIAAMVKAVQKAGLPAAVSNSAGTYVCNTVLYTSLRAAQALPDGARVGFLHLPFLPEQVRGRENLPSMALEEQMRALTACLTAAVRESTNYTYILRCDDGSLYTGWTNDLPRRLAAHTRREGAKYTKSHPVAALVYSESFLYREQAMAREWQLKQLTHAQKLALIGGEK